MKDIGETIFAALAVVVLCVVVIVNNAEGLAAAMVWAQSSVAGPARDASSGGGGSFFVQNLVGFAVVSVIGGIWLWVRRVPQQASDKPAGVGYRHSRKLRTASDLRKLTEV